MTGTPDVPAGAAAPMDRRDLELLAGIVAIHDALDPMPAMLPDMVLLALGATDLDAEMARLIESESSLAGTRGADQPVEHARRITFSSEHLTVMVAVERNADGTVRLDGWAAPGAHLRVELRGGERTVQGQCDADGRFVLDGVPTGPAQLVLHPTDESDPAVRLPVVTPAVQL
ncbi:carboxypeptidase regulatory-like domain-containing protein [Nakamurella endophytica]|uniref:Carboxypeptidase regulatory-like domain-containing protein n=1 Tax=Nakamurella endophytica TaxID=1748367 RepID=A0A917SNW3_9ACTN|nr:carboxypeptidase regulatory-like domain-containing protein [Nakamurella endophytica]GGL91241.1 hypothetical protein GCM10011594_08660 [Nakamurella endophytica]